MGKKKSKEEDKTSIKIIAMILLGILGSLSLIGIFWGREGLIFIGLGVLFVASIMILSLTRI